MNDGEFRNNQLDRAVTWNEGGVLDGARHVHLAGDIAYITADRGLVVVDRWWWSISPIRSNHNSPPCAKCMMRGQVRSSSAIFG